MGAVTLGGRSLELPSLIPSTSSFETQIQPIDALRLQITLHEPVSLISAYDLAKDETGELVKLCQTFRRQGIMFLDSGGYETSRVGKYGAPHSWTLEDFLKAAEPDLFDVSFSFDLFPEPPHQTWKEYAEALGDLLDGHSDRIADEKLIPVVHLATKDGKSRFSDADAIALVRYVAESRSHAFVAVTERELGSGLSARISLIRKIKLALDQSRVLLHVLGCGNPLSFAAFAEAGVDSCDGLEWCRTYCSSDMRLYHFQHSHNIGSVIEPTSVQTDLLLATTHDYYVKTSVINLNNFSHIIRSVQAAPSKAIEALSKTYNEPIRI